MIHTTSQRYKPRLKVELQDLCGVGKYFSISAEARSDNVLCKVVAKPEVAAFARLR